MDRLLDEWLVWRLWEAGKVTLEEIDRSWSLEDVLDANEVLDAYEEARMEASRIAAGKRS